MNVNIVIKRAADLARLLVRDPFSARYAFTWMKTNCGERPAFLKQYPWMVFKAITWLALYLTPDMTIFEYGSGGSTFYFSQRVKKIVSVEFNRPWYEKMKSYIDAQNIRLPIELLLREAEPNAELAAPYTHENFTSELRKELTFEKFVKAIDDYPDHFFDLVIVDGRARASCLARAAQKVRPGGYVLLDNSDRSTYQDAMKLLANYQRQDFHGIGPYSRNLWSTTIWKVK